jgi:hypothetical protein
MTTDDIGMLIIICLFCILGCAIGVLVYLGTGNAYLGVASFLFSILIAFK